MQHRALPRVDCFVMLALMTCAIIAFLPALSSPGTSRRRQITFSLRQFDRGGWDEPGHRLRMFPYQECTLSSPGKRPEPAPGAD